MNVPSALARYSIEQLLEAFGVIVIGGPYAEETRPIIQNLGVHRFARVITHQYRRDRRLCTDIVSAEMTEAGARFLHELQVAAGIVDG